MSKYTQQTYDVTQDAVNYILTQMDNFYLAHPMPEKEGDPEDSVAIYFNVLFKGVIKGWKDLECARHPYDYNRKMAEHSDRSPRTLRSFYNKK